MAGFRVVIPARYGSTRFPGKVLTPIAGAPMLQHVWAAALASGADEVVVATDDGRVVAECERMGASVMRTAAGHRSGTDRISEVAKRQGWADGDVLVNVQGDEPLMPPALIAQVAQALIQRPRTEIASACSVLADKESWHNSNIVKVVRDCYGDALYFSRASIPFDRGDDPAVGKATLARRHIGIYAYRVGALRRFSDYGSCALERCEALEQLRAQWHGMKIRVVDADVLPGPGVDTPSDVFLVEAYLRGTAKPS